MASNRDESLTYTNPSYSSSPITASFDGDGYLVEPTSTPQIGSAAGSFQNEGFLGDSGAAVSSGSDADFGFLRPTFRQDPLAGTVQLYHRHVFLCYKNPQVWPAQIEAAEFDRLPRLLSAALMARKGDMKKQTRLTICEGHDGTETSNGDVLIFPYMIRYRRLTHFDVDTFVEEVLVKDGEWLPGTPETLKGSFVFICSHGSRDRRCGICGPPLVARFKEEIEARSLYGKVSISPCSHVGGHKYAGNVIIFASNVDGDVTGHWYGYVTPDDVPILLEQHIGNGEIVDRLWRGQMGLSEEEQIKSQELRLQLNRDNKDTSTGKNTKEPTQLQANIAESQVEAAGCCQANGTVSSCCQNPTLPETIEKCNGNDQEGNVIDEKKMDKKRFSRTNSGKARCTRKTCSMPTWFESWEREDTYAALAVICAAVSVGVAYSCYKNLT